MTGLKSGSGDDLWGDDSDETDEVEENKAEAPTDVDQSVSDEANEQTEESAQMTATEAVSEKEVTSTSSKSSNTQQPYIVRRAIQDRSVQFERNERLTFFVHDDVVNGERDLITEVESELGRSVPKFDVREAVYRAALRNRDDVLDELLKMGYSPDDNP